MLIEKNLVFFPTAFVMVVIFYAIHYRFALFSLNEIEKQNSTIDPFIFEFFESVTVPRLFVAVEEDAVDDTTDHADRRGDVEDLLPRLERLLEEKEKSVRTCLFHSHFYW